MLIKRNSPETKSLLAKCCLDKWPVLMKLKHLRVHFRRSPARCTDLAIVVWELKAFLI